jgi:hypothetical protein
MISLRFGAIVPKTSLLPSLEDGRQLPLEAWLKAEQELNTNVGNLALVAIVGLAATEEKQDTRPRPGNPRVDRLKKLIEQLAKVAKETNEAIQKALQQITEQGGVEEALLDEVKKNQKTVNEGLAIIRQACL